MEDVDSNAKRCKPAEASGTEKDGVKPSNEENSSANAGAGAGAQRQSKESSKPPEPPKQDYIHVRARRGQATDSHSLAERVRSKRISFSKRMLFHFITSRLELA